MPEMITVRCPQCGKKLLFSPFDNYKKASLECPACHYTGLVETYPEITDASQPQGRRPHSSQTSSSTSGTSNTRRSSASHSLNDNQPKGFALKFPWVIAGLAVAIIILYVCLQCLSTNEVI